LQQLPEEDHHQTWNNVILFCILSNSWTKNAFGLYRIYFKKLPVSFWQIQPLFLLTLKK
jgi:hypothetical protein